MSTARLEYPAGLKHLSRCRIVQDTLQASNIEIDLGDKATVTLESLNFSFNPVFDFDLQVEDWQVQYFICVATGQFQANLDASIEVNAITNLLEKEETIFTISWPEPAGVAMVGPVPVVWEFFLDMNIGASVSAGNVGTLAGNLDINTAIKTGAEYCGCNQDNPGWHPVGDFTFDADANLGDWTISPLSAKIYIKPEFGVKFYKVVGPSISHEEYLQLAGNYKFDTLGAELRNGRESNLNFTFEVIDPIKFQYSRNLYNDSDVLMARLAYGANPTDLGTIDYTPLGLNGIYWHTVNVDVSATATSGYELAGYSIQNLLTYGDRIEKTATLDAEPANASKLITAHFVPEGEGDNWSGSGITSQEGSIVVETEVWPLDAGRIILFPTLAGYFSGDNLLVQAAANNGFVFHHWERSIEGTEPVTEFTVTSNAKYLKAIFASDPPRTLNVPGDYATIQQALDAATYNDTIALAAGTYSGPGNRDLDLSDCYARDIIIRGQGCGITIIDLQGSAGDPHRLAELGDPDGTIRIEDLTISNGYAGTGDPDGGAIKVVNTYDAAVENPFSLEIVNCCFEDCQAEDEGGAIFLSNPDNIQNLLIQDNTFSNCTGEGAVYLKSTKVELTTAISDCTFSNNIGGIDLNQFEGTIAITDSTFTNNLDRAAIRALSSTQITVSNCSFIGNQATENGPAIHSQLSTLSASDCTFTTNSLQVQSYGGAVWTRDEATFENCTFEMNTANIGGAAAILEGGTLRNCTFTDNTAESDGGALYLGGKAFDCIFTGNTAGDSGGAAFLYDGTIESCTLTDNTSRSWGGGIDTGYGGGTISSCFISNNTGAGAGGIKAKNALIRNSIISNNIATDSYAGGILANSCKVFGCIIENNQALDNHTGGLEARDCLVSGCSISFNSASEEGGGIVARESTISDCLLRENTATEGGGILCRDEETEIYDLTFTNNTPDNCTECTNCP